MERPNRYPGALSFSKPSKLDWAVIKLGGPKFEDQRPTTNRETGEMDRSQI
jgi:hypothetical protein